MKKFYTKLSNLSKATKLSLILVALSLFKLYRLNGGIVLGEPDEQIHLELVKNLSDFPYPEYPKGVGWFYNLPLYPYLGFLINLFVNNEFLSLRIVSVIFSILLTLGIFFYLTKKVSQETAFLTSLLFIFTPLTLFYSRLGLIDMTVTALSFLALFLFELSLTSKHWKRSILAGFILGLAILTKYSSLTFLASLIIIASFVIFKDFLRGKLRSIATVFKHPAVINFFITGVVVTPVFLTLFFHERFRFKQQLKATLLETPEFWGNGSLNFFPELFAFIPYWLSWEVVALFFVGLVFLFSQKQKSFWYFSLTFLIVFFFVFKRKPLPRYFLIMAPFIIMTAGLGFEWLKTTVKPKLMRAAIIILFFGLLMPQSFTAFNSSYHTLTEETGKYVDSLNNKDQFVFSTYWPNIFNEASFGTNYTWLTLSPWDTGAFGKVPETKHSLDLLKKYGGFALIEDVYTRILYSEMDKVKVAGFFGGDVRRGAEEEVTKNFQEIKRIEDRSPNFPFSKTEVNSVKVFRVFGEEENK